MTRDEQAEVLLRAVEAGGFPFVERWRMDERRFGRGGFPGLVEKMLSAARGFLGEPVKDPLIALAAMVLGRSRNQKWKPVHETVEDLAAAWKAKHNFAGKLLREAGIECGDQK